MSDMDTMIEYMIKEKTFSNTYQKKKWLKSVRCNPCVNCGSTEMEVWHGHTYTSDRLITLGEIKCICKNKVETETFSDPLPLLVKAWNRMNPLPEEEIIILENKIKEAKERIKEAKERIKKLKK